MLKPFRRRDKIQNLMGWPVIILRDLPGFLVASVVPRLLTSRPTTGRAVEAQFAAHTKA